MPARKCNLEIIDIQSIPVLLLFGYKQSDLLHSCDCVISTQIRVNRSPVVEGCRHFDLFKYK
jgi:hypothetical protein